MINFRYKTISGNNRIFGKILNIQKQMQEESDLHCYEKQRLPKIWIIEKWTDCLRKIFLARNLDLEKSQGV